MNKKFKEILKSGEENYDPKAWDSLAGKLNAVMPVQKTSFPFTKIIVFSAVSIALVSLFTYVIYDENKAVEYVNINNSLDKVTEEKSTEVEKIQVGEKNHLSAKEKSSKKEKASDVVANVLNHEQENKEVTKLTAIPEKMEEKSEISTNNSADISEKPLNKIVFKENYCLNDEIELSNKNAKDIEILNERKDIVLILKPFKSYKLKMNETGSFFIKYPDVLIEKAYRVAAAPSVDFSYENEIYYEKGLPYLNLKSATSNQEIEWTTNKGYFSKQSENTQLFVFKKGKYDVVLSTKNDQSCRSTKKQSIFVEEDYNLLAPTAFIPNDLDERNREFMPFALTQRAVNFELIIIDPDNGRIVFRSKSAQNKWNGEDLNTGQQVKELKSYIWKVSLFNPEPSEKNEYSGTVTVINKK